AIEAGGVLAEEVDVLAAVEGGHPRAASPDKSDGERLAEEGGARVATGQHLRRLAVLFPAARIRVDETCPRGFERCGDGLVLGIGKHGSSLPGSADLDVE